MAFNYAFLHLLSHYGSEISRESRYIFLAFGMHLLIFRSSLALRLIFPTISLSVKNFKLHCYLSNSLYHGSSSQPSSIFPLCFHFANFGVCVLSSFDLNILSQILDDDTSCVCTFNSNIAERQNPSRTTIMIKRI